MADQLTAATPSAKYVGRPSKSCPKCKSIHHYVNTMGGIQCLSCNPPPPTFSLTDLAGRKLAAVDGIWEQDDGRFDNIVKTSSKIAPVQSKRDNSSSLDISNVFTDVDASGAFLRDFNSGEIIFQEQSFVTRSRWTPDERSIVDWFLAISSPEPTNSAALAQLSSRLTNRRISPFEVVRDPSRFLGELRSQCEAGPGGVRQHYGGLIDDLRRLMFWTMEFESHIQNQPSREPGDEPDEIDRLEELDSREPFDPRRTSREIVSFDFPIPTKTAAVPVPVSIPFPAFDLSALTFGL